LADLIPTKNRSLTAAQYGALADVPPEIEWLANITNPKTRRAYKNDVSEFSAFTGLRNPVELRTVTRAQQMANHESVRTTGLYDRRNDQVSLDEVERILI
jgi:integrase/recombinase XerD